MTRLIAESCVAQKNMRIVFFEIKSSTVAALLVAAVFLISLFLGFGQGKILAQGENSLKQAQELQKGLEFFYKDQNRFPTAEELTQENTALTYFSAVPNSSSNNSVCPQSFNYIRPSQTSYQLNFCLPADLAGYKKGWNQVVEQK